MGELENGGALVFFDEGAWVAPVGSTSKRASERKWEIGNRKFGKRRDPGLPGMCQERDLLGGEVADLSSGGGAGT